VNVESVVSAIVPHTGTIAAANFKHAKPQVLNVHGLGNLKGRVDCQAATMDATKSTSWYTMRSCANDCGSSALRNTMARVRYVANPPPSMIPPNHCSTQGPSNLQLATTTQTVANMLHHAHCLENLRRSFQFERSMTDATTSFIGKLDHPSLVSMMSGTRHAYTSETKMEYASG